MGKVLIIDDEKQILGLLSRIIGLEGYEVLQAATCKAGLRQMEQHSPEVVLCDVFLPDGNGVDLVSDLKKLRHSSYHGFALNVSANLEPFSYINPCGYEGLRIVNLNKFAQNATLESTKKVLIEKIKEQFCEKRC